MNGFDFSKLKDWQKRVVKEAEILNGKMERLNKFIETDDFKDLDKQDRTLLVCQIVNMKAYHTVLQKRINRFHGEQSK